MGKFIYADYSMKDRVTLLKNQAIKSSVETYNRSLSDKEIDAEKDRYSRDAIELERQKDELKRQMEILKQGIDSLTTLMKERLSRIKTGQMEVHGMLYGIADHGNGRMTFYDQYGELIHSRELTPDEWQGRLFIGDAPSEGGNNTPVESGGDDGIMDVDYEDVNESQSLEEAIDEMYAEEGGGNVDVPQQEPEEDKPKKKPGRKPRKKKDETPEDEDDLPI